MATVSVIGAGLAGPAAALVLARMGHQVTVYERRSERDLYSASTIGITTANMQALEGLGMANVPYHAAGALAYRGVIHDGPIEMQSDPWTTTYNIVVWGDLHNGLVRAGMANGVEYRFRANGASVTAADVQVHANGIAYAGHHSTFTYAGYSVFRGVYYGALPENAAAAVWVALHDSRKVVALNIGKAPQWYAWMFYMHEANPPLRTEVAPYGSERYNAVRQTASAHLPPEWARVVLDSPGEYLANPIGDWTMPALLTWRGEDYGDRGLHFDIGDAVAPVRPHTTMGANLGITDALTLPAGLSNPGEWEREAKERRAKEIDRGRVLGLRLLGG